MAFHFILVKRCGIPSANLAAARLPSWREVNGKSGRPRAGRSTRHSTQRQFWKRDKRTHSKHATATRAKNPFARFRRRECLFDRPEASERHGGRKDGMIFHPREFGVADEPRSPLSLLSSRKSSTLSRDKLGLETPRAGRLLYEFMCMSIYTPIMPPWQVLAARNERTEVLYDTTGLCCISGQANC